MPSDPVRMTVRDKEESDRAFQEWLASPTNMYNEPDDAWNAAVAWARSLPPPPPADNFAKRYEDHLKGCAIMDEILKGIGLVDDSGDENAGCWRNDRAEKAEAKLIAEKETWRCFHCDEVFTSRKYAAEHFGSDEGDTPACRLSHSDGHLVTLIRKLQRELASYRREDNHILRAWDARVMEGVDAIRKAEERGFDRGVQDAKKMFEEEHAAGTPDAEAVRMAEILEQTATDDQFIGLVVAGLMRDAAATIRRLAALVESLERERDEWKKRAKDMHEAQGADAQLAEIRRLERDALRDRLAAVEGEYGPIPEGSVRCTRCRKQYPVDEIDMWCPCGGEWEWKHEGYMARIRYLIYEGVAWKSERDTARADVARLERELAGRTVPGQCPWDLPFDSICPKHGGPLAHCPINKANSGITFDRETT